MHAGINQCVTTMQKSANYATAWKVINLSTDGYPNSTSAAEAAVTNAVAAGIQEIDAEGIGTGAANDWMAQDMVYPDGPGGAKGPIVPDQPYPPRPPNPSFMGFVRKVTTFAEYEEAIKEKLRLILKGQLFLEPPSATNTINTQHCVTATLNDGYGAPVVGANITFTVTGANPTSGWALTDANGEADFCYTGTNVGTDTIVATAEDPENPPNILTSKVATKDWEEDGVTPPPQVPSITEWGIIVTAILLAGLIPIALRRRALSSVSR
jgi:hypothetical protein